MPKPLSVLKNFLSLHRISEIFREFAAQMAESVDALVSNTSRATCAGSTPALGTIFSSLQFFDLQGVFLCSSWWQICSGRLELLIN